MPAHPVDADTLGCWRFNENSEAPAIFADAAGNYPLTVSGNPCPTYIPPRFGLAHYAMGGEMQHVGDSALCVAGLGDLTWECWFKPNSGMTPPVVLCQIGDDGGSDGGAKNAVFSVRLISFNGSYYQLVVVWQSLNHWTGNQVFLGLIIPAYEAGGAWMHLAVVRSGLNVRAYLNGVLAGSGAGSSAPDYNRQTPTARLWVHYGFIGAIDDSRLSKVARTAEEIATDALGSDSPLRLLSAKSPLSRASGFFQKVQRRSLTWFGGTYRKSHLLDAQGAGPGPVVVPLTFIAEMSEPSIAQLVFSRAVVHSADLENPAHYTVTPPPGLPAPTVASATFVSPTVTALRLSGDLLDGGTYTVQLAVKTAMALDDGTGNDLGGQNFSAAYTRPYVESAIAGPPQLSHSTVVVRFSRAMRMVSSGNPDDALNPSNYAIVEELTGTPVGVDSVVMLNSTMVQLTTDLLHPIRYLLTVSNVLDIPGNLVES